MLDAGEDMVDDASRFIARVPPDVRPAPGERSACGWTSTACTSSTPTTEEVIR